MHFSRRLRDRKNLALQVSTCRLDREGREVASGVRLRFFASPDRRPQEKTPMNIRSATCAVVTSIILSSSSALAQSFNLDVGTTNVSGSGFGAPSIGFGAAANQVGFWNSINGSTVT